ncbi:HlyD family type I secretion periplasmic adaptor subunit [Mangrovicoccus sp. HB161399]|uniref:HlyD family type I secretion periplasmic adaptor subunit n=1 Tax=Mangrovicoccus sp. HB161399 TaxID=2720392 RepID=UPI00155243BC|nr:HlyD family type I secretion periplasmic adaptor subunit [Mangrovicoccus sp. HB161399]
MAPRGSLPPATVPEQLRAVPQRPRPLQRLTSPQLRHLAESARLEERPDHVGSRLTIWSIAAMLAAFLVWAGFARLPEIARAEGQITPSGFERELQLPEGGTLASLSVRSGQTVAAGEEIARFDDRAQRAELRQAEQQQLSLRIRAEWLSAFAEERDPDFAGFGGAEDAEEVAAGRAAYRAMLASLADRQRITDEQIAQNARDYSILAEERIAEQSRVAAMRDILGRREQLHEKGLVVYTAILESRQDVTDAETALAALGDRMQRNRIAQRELEAQRESQASADIAAARGTLQETRADLAGAAIRIANLREEIDGRRLLAPLAGTVKLPERLAPGDFVAAGRPVAHIVPEGDRLVARVRIPAADVSRVSPGQHAELRVGALDFTRFGKVPGEVVAVSPGALISERGEVYYAAEIALEVQSLSDGQDRQSLLPGMPVDAEIVNGSRTILEYLFKPVKLALEDAFRE